MVLESLVQAGGLLLGFLLAIREASASDDDVMALCEKLRAFDRRVRLLPMPTSASGSAGLREALAAWRGAAVRTSVPASATVKFRRAVVPGDTMVVHLRAVREMGELWHCEGEITVDSQVVLDGTIVLLVRELPAPARELG
jgi:3-hydroxymyristoyl/3-hydroxydecanoyl-(acyl carrier protein) dehydratase